MNTKSDLSYEESAREMYEASRDEEVEPRWEALTPEEKQCALSNFHLHLKCESDRDRLLAWQQEDWAQDMMDDLPF